MYKRILLAVDGSENALRATGEAAKIASLVEGSVVTIIYVADFAKAKNEVLHARGLEELDLSRRKKIQPAEEILKSFDVSYHVEIIHGEPRAAIIRFANKNKFDIAILGSRGLNAFQEMVLGSVSHKAVKRIECPVLIVK